MASGNFIKLSGTCKWARLVDKDPKYGVWSIVLYLDEASKKTFEKSGLQLQVKTDDDGDYIQLRRKGVLVKSSGEVVNFDPPKVYGPDKADIDGRTVGNGSKVVCGISVYPTAKGNGHRLNFVDVKEHVVFDPKPHDPF